MSKVQSTAKHPINLSQLQNTLEQATTDLKVAQQAKRIADETFTQALASHEAARVALNKGVFSLQNATTVPNLYAEIQA